MNRSKRLRRAAKRFIIFIVLFLVEKDILRILEYGRAKKEFASYNKYYGK